VLIAAASVEVEKGGNRARNGGLMRECLRVDRALNQRGIGSDKFQNIRLIGLAMESILLALIVDNPAASGREDFAGFNRKAKLNKENV